MELNLNEQAEDSSRRWRFEPSSLTLVFRNENIPPYAIDLRRISSSACMLNEIFQASSQRWANPEVIGDLVKALQELFDPQVTLCALGKDKKLDPVALLRSRWVN